MNNIKYISDEIYAISIIMILSKRLSRIGVLFRLEVLLAKTKVIWIVNMFMRKNVGIKIKKHNSF